MAARASKALIADSQAFTAAADAASIAPSLDLNGPAAGTSSTAAFDENGAPVAIAPDAVLTDPDSPDFGGGSLRVAFYQGGAAGDQLQVISGNFTVEEQDLFYGGVYVGSIAGGNDESTPLVITFTTDATLEIVQELVRSIGYVNFSDDPGAASRGVYFVVSDGDGGTSDPVTASISVAPDDDPPVAYDDNVAATEDQPATGSVFADNGNGADSDPDQPPLAVGAVNDDPNAVGQTVTLASGALLTVNADGTYTYDPNHAFDYLVADGSGATGTQATDSFTYTLLGGNEATVTVTISGVAHEGDVLAGDSDNNDIAGSPYGEYFDLSQGGNDNAQGNGGDDYFWFGGAFTNGDSVDGGAGTDVVGLLGTYALTFDSNDLVNIERLTLFSGTTLRGESHVTYTLTTVDANVAADKVLTVLGTTLLSDEVLVFNGRAETDGHFLIRGGAAGDTLVGGQQIDFLYGGAGNDQLYGQGGNDLLQGDFGADQLRGGFGDDRFVYLSASDSTDQGMDVILDLEPGHDRIDLSAIDADPELNGDQAFTFIGDGDFSGTAGELRAYQGEGSSWFVEGDVDGDGTADLLIQVNTFGGHVVQASDFIL
ncbi:MAG: M10 family metallopeptidase C-terminal domain-containing protein [Alphaproteobacteria bacterium]|nr:M10 family metallopeptidase C-terminal domain-containing protein [Alphaproteobacteria bacterium]MBV9372453.1 M10 family metallopeptidase C-terminal domain-containing protein [Alphaproteobacteria bacterium]MBV9902128.1 M10 family metallopeptidase C-terminal domain-containing protein [Alphaproteobacteria bacterium]